MDIETLELAEAMRANAEATKDQTASLDAHVAAIKSVTKGDTGERGAKGEQGPPGKDGSPGKPGRLGADGQRGPVGADGRDGSSGKTGPAGKDGVGPDEKVRVSATDASTGYLAEKLTAGSGVEIQRKSKNGDERLVIVATPPPPSMGGGGASAIVVYDDGLGGIAGNKVSFDGGDPITVSGGIIHVPVGSTGGGSDDQTAAEVPFTPAGSIAATNVQAAIEEVAAEAGGSGLPSQWTDGGNGDVTATTDDPAKTALTVAATTGQDTASPVFQVLDELGNPIVVVTQEPDAIATTMDLFAGTLLGWLVHLDQNPGLYTEAFVRANVNSVARLTFDAFSDTVDPTASYTTLTLRAFADQVPPLLEVKDGAAATVFAVGGNGQFGTFDKAATPAVQQTVADIADPTIATPETNATKINELLGALRAYGLLA